MPIVRGRVVAAPEVDFRAGDVDLYGDPPVAPVPGRIRAVISQKVVRRTILLNSFVDLTEIVGIEEGAPTCIACESDQGFLGCEVGVQGIHHGLPGIGGSAAQAGVLRLSPGHDRLQAAEIHGVDRHIGAYGCIGIPMQPYAPIWRSTPWISAACRRSWPGERRRTP